MSGGLAGIERSEYIKLEADYKTIKRFEQEPGSAITGTARVGKLDEERKSSIANKLQADGFGAVVNIGGNGTIQQSKDLDKIFKGKIQIVSCPKTVDNDLGDKELSELYFTPGFISCIKWWDKIINYIDIENQGAYEHEPVLVVQTFGRETGFIAASIGHSIGNKAPIVYGIPESNESIEQLISRVRKLSRKKKDA